MSEGVTDVHEQAVHLNGVRWAYTDRGSGPLVVFLHGTLSSSAMYADLINTLCDRYRCVAVDLPGHGRSGFDHRGWTVDDVVAGVTALISHLDQTPATLVGLSQGGAVALRVAIGHPTLVEALVVQSAGPDGPAPEALAGLAAVARTLETGGDDQRRAAAVELQPTLHAAGWVVAHPREAERELAIMLAHDRRAISLSARVPATYISVENELAQINCPALIMWGDEDPRAFWGPRMAAAMPAAQLIAVPHAGHHMTADVPELCAAEIAGFLDRVHADPLVESRATVTAAAKRTEGPPRTTP